MLGDFTLKSLTPSVKVTLEYMIQQNRLILFLDTSNITSSHASSTFQIDTILV